MYKKFISGAGWMFAGNASQQILQFITFIILARLLAPEIFGQVALASVVTDIAGAVALWGLPQFLIQRGLLVRTMQSHAYVLAILIALVLSVLIVTGVLIYAWAHEFTLVSQLILLQTPLLLIQAIGIVPDALFRRNLDFKLLAFRNNLAAFFGGGVALTLAFLDYGVYALVAQKVVAISILTLTVWWALEQRSFARPAGIKVATLLMISRQSLRLLSNQIATLVGVRAMDGIIGLWLGNAVLGQFKIVMRIYDLLVQLAVSPLSAVALAAFPKLIADNEALRKFYNHLVTFSLVVFVPVMTGVAFTADKWVPMILGPQWMEVVPLFQIISITSVQCILGTFQNALQMSLRWNHFVFKQNMLRLVTSVLLTLFAAQFNIYLILVFYAVWAYGLAIYNARALNVARGWPWSDLLTTLLPSLAPTAIMLIGLIGLGRWTNTGNVEALVVDIVVGAVLYAMTFLLIFSRQAGMLLQLLKTKKTEALL